MQTKRHEGRNDPVLDPDLPIVDSHFHLFDLPGNRYMLDDYLADAQGGHNVVASVYCETQTFARTAAATGCGRWARSNSPTASPT
ncbi:hypothetical protein [Mangrovicoccus ximenensis]|uniref:hypothetical protein n=1 Tax=Mangrovicoccus ximenensis TaxID=1911570 RepID=UPI00191BE88A|nr:hypothetical protein [Mangrovicoccus ximenensis]